MIDKSRRPRGAGDVVPAFAPVPRHYNRFDGWTPERQRAFIEALADTGSVKAAAHAVNMAPEGAYQLRRHPQAGDFRKAWEAALASGVQRLEDVAMERALHGQQVPVYSYGKLIGSRTVFNDRLLMFILRNRAPTRFDEHGRATARRNAINSPADANRISRLKKQWRKEWEEELAAQKTRNSDQALAEIDAMLDRQRHNWLAHMTPRTREAYATYKRIEAEEDGEEYEPEVFPPYVHAQDRDDDEEDSA